MNSVEQIAGKAKTGIWGLDNILSGGFSRGHIFLIEGRTGHRQDHGRAAIPCLKARAPAKSASTSHCPKPSANCARAPRLTAGPWATASRCSNCCRRKACWIPSSSKACSIPPISNSAKPPSRFSKRSNAAGRPGGSRQPVRDQAAGAEFAALSAADSGDQALFREVRHYGDVIRRSDRRGRRQDRAQRRAWCVPARRTGAGLRRGTAARAHHQISRCEIPRRLP